MAMQRMPEGYQPHGGPMGHGQIMPAGGEMGGANSSMAAVAQLFARLSQEIEEKKPPNCIHFIVNFLCKHYPEHLHGFASIWQADPDLERERHEVVNFFKSHKIGTAVAAHFTNAGYDTLDTLTTITPDSLVDVESFNNVKWLPGHKVRLQQIFAEISARVRAYRQAHPNQTAGVVGRPAVPSNVAPVGIATTTTAAHAPREYVVGVSAPVRIGQPALPMATAGVDVNHDGRANFMVTGVDANRDGIPDVLQQQQIHYMGGPQQLALAAPPPGVPHAPHPPAHPPVHPGHGHAGAPKKGGGGWHLF